MNKLEIILEQISQKLDESQNNELLIEGLKSINSTIENRLNSLTKNIKEEVNHARLSVDKDKDRLSQLAKGQAKILQYVEHLNFTRKINHDHPGKRASLWNLKRFSFTLLILAFISISINTWQFFAYLDIYQDSQKYNWISNFHGNSEIHKEAEMIWSDDSLRNVNIDSLKRISKINSLKQQLIQLETNSQ